ncbi:MAG TPA: Holliday junction resolvase RuvX [Chitinophagales bacterium]|jgi:putative Holliday junction resolvase|nr:Holliday junction resolvase RuvX [Chitinophagales bacterium]HPA35873.1 Holliday junction resolvase RuvX [Chitinophagales bacterium]HPW86357.1 Holliday junction resolvase RuvX [Chitinophagales bacterium]HQD11937.1 Holliday junction resolvase RuvX [Chitinophagales bacterium]HQO30934.1 Holliday junction resolvase RuvX [Chitinophagales bacterium]
MAKILAIDYGSKRTGFALSDDSKTFAFGLSTQNTHEILPYLDKLVPKEKIDTIVIGEPKTLTNEPAAITPKIDLLKRQLTNRFPDVQLVSMDERFTSKMAFQSMIDSGMKKKDRQNKALVDEISATLILQQYLETL